MNRFSSVVCCIALVLMFWNVATPVLGQQVPRHISYQGILTDGGKPLAGTHTITVQLYDSPLAQKPLWTEEHSTVINDGLFNLTLGVTTPLLLPFDRAYFIGVSIDGKPEMSRVPLAAAPYALQAAEAQSLAPNATGAVTSLNGQEGAVSLVGSNGIKVQNDGGLLRVELDRSTMKKGEGIQTPPDGAAGGDLSGNYPNPQIASGAVSTSRLANDAVTSGKIADGTITMSDIADGAIATAKLAIGAVTSEKIADATITTLDIADGGVQASDIAINAVVTDKIRDLNVTSPKLADGAVTTAKIANGAVTGVKLADGSISGAKLVDGTVTTTKLADDAVTAAKLADNSVFSNNIAANAVQTADIANAAVTPAKISTTGAVSGDVMTYNGSSATWGTPSGSVPSGFMIAGFTTTAPTGYTYTGVFMKADSMVWSAKAGMTTARAQLGAAVAGGKIYAMGGFNGTFLSVNEEYTPASNTWATKTAMPAPRRGFGCTEVNGRIYTTMGYDSTGTLRADSLAREYDPVSNSWTTKATNTNGCRLMSFGAAAVNGVIYCLGGASGGDGQFSSCASTAFKYTVGTNTWDTVQPQDGFSYFWFNGTQACVANNKIYFGGARFDNDAALSEYDPATKTFRANVTQLPAGKRYQALVAIGNNIYSIGGNTGSGQPYSSLFTAQSRTDVYNLITQTWSEGPNIPVPTWGCGGVVLNGKIYVVGGINGATYLNNLQELTIAQKNVYYHAKN